MVFYIGGAQRKCLSDIGIYFFSIEMSI